MAESGSTRIQAVQNQDEQHDPTDDDAPAKCRNCRAAFFVNRKHRARWPWSRVTTSYTCEKCQDKRKSLAEIESRTKVELGQQKLDFEKLRKEEEERKLQLAHESALATAEYMLKLKLAEHEVEARIAEIQADMKVKLAVERTRQYEIERDIQENGSERQKLAFKEFRALQEAGENVTVHDLIKLLEAVKTKSRVNIPSTNSRCTKFTGDRSIKTSKNTANWMFASTQY